MHNLGWRNIFTVGEVGNLLLGCATWNLTFSALNKYCFKYP